jgi:hypothetical protein
MKPLLVIVSAGAAMWLLSSCATRAVSTYPSYERTLARYSPPPAEGIPAANPGYDSPEDCDCPRVWYRDRWIYHCDEEWLYWHAGYWYYYPHMHVYYYHGVPRVYPGTGRTIHKR